MTPEEHEEAANLLDISPEDFLQEYASHTLVDNTTNETWVRLSDKPSNKEEDSHGCIFLQSDNTCQIYEARPIQCSTYPFWPSILESREAWNKEVCRADDDNDKESSKSHLPLWTANGGGCEGMQLVLDDEDDDDGNDNDDDDLDMSVGVPKEQVYEQAYWSEYDERRFPRGKEIPVRPRNQLPGSWKYKG